MHLIRPFAGLRPAPGRAAEVIAPPYDVLSSDEARKRAAGKPWSFLHISKPEIDLPAGTNPYAPEVYAKAAENLNRMTREGVLVRDAAPCYYVYRLVMGGHTQTGLVAAASVAEYDTNRIRKHEHTQQDKEDDRVRQIDALNAQTGPVMVAYPPAKEVDDILARCSAGTPDADAVADGGVRHTLWVVRDGETQARLTQAFDAMPAIYIADGHHRSAAASRVAAARRAANPRHGGEESYNYFLTVIFPHHQMRILDYNRVVSGLNGMDAETFLKRVRQTFAVDTSAAPVKPAQPGEFGLYLAGQWYRLTNPPRADSRRRSRGPYRRQPADRPPARAGAGHHRSAPRQAHRLRRRYSRARRTGEACGERRDDRSLRGIPHVHGRHDGGRRSRQGHAYEIDVVRAQAGGRAGFARARLKRVQRATASS